MRASKIMVVTLIFMVGFLISSGISGVEAQFAPGEYLGQFCWDNLGATVVLGVTHMGDNHFLVSGTVTFLQGDTAPFHGNAEIVGGQVLMTVNASGDELTEVFATTAHVILDPATLDGTIEFLNVVHLN
ncbi:MAG: hypothetical protein ACE5MG_12610 [Candidatus Methylomirabilales bacterium]